LVTRLLERMVKVEEKPQPPPKVRKDNSEEIQRLTRIIGVLEDKIAALELEIKLRRNDLDLFKEYAVEVESLSAHLRNLQGERAALETQKKDLERSWQERLAELSNRNNQLLQERDEVMRQFNEYKQAEEQKLKQAVRELNLQIDRVNDQLQQQLQENQRKDKL